MITIESTEFTDYPASFAQKRLWFLNKLDPGSPQYNINYSFRLKGALDVEKLQRCFNLLVSRHQGLRTNFVELNGEVYQRVHNVRHLTIETINATRQQSSILPVEADQITRQFSRRVYKLDNELLLRILWISTGEEGGTLACSMHHIISDFTSWKILFGQLADAYSIPSTWHALEGASYIDYTVWQEAWLSKRDVKDGIESYINKLSGKPELLTLPTQKPRPRVQCFEGAIGRLVLNDEVILGFKATAKEAKTSLFMTMLSAFKILLMRYSSQNDITVATLPAGRTHRDHENIIGFFVNTMPLRTVIDPQMNFLDLLSSVRDTTLSAFDYINVPYDLIINKLNPERELSYSPVAQVAFVLHHSTDIMFKLPGIEVSFLDNDNKTAKFDITLCVFESPHQTELLLEYSTALFTEYFAKQMLDDFSTLLSTINACPHSTVSHLASFGIAGRHTPYNRAADVYDRNYVSDFFPVHEIVNQQSLLNPDAVALVFDGKYMTYRELHDKSTSVAQQLIGLGCRVEDKVGVYSSRNIDLPIVILGVLKAGGIYVALEPEYPSRRLEQILQDARPTIIIKTSEHLLEKLNFFGGPIVKPTYDLGAEPIKMPLLNPQNGAYILYTSGSTGIPKGVLVNHQAFANRVVWASGTFPLTSEDRVLYKTPFTFDVSVGEMFWPLASGARLVILEPGAHREPRAIIASILEHNISGLELVPSMLQVLVTDPLFPKCTSLKYILCNGEPLPLNTILKCHAALPAHLYNLYGPTEATINVSYWDTTQACISPEVYIGQPIENVNLYILDEHLNVCPGYVTGEVYIGGEVLARGYVNRPKETASYFIPDPFRPDVPGARMYRTGDLGRTTETGIIELFGRVDNQVKVRGNRIELSEVESHLLTCPGVVQVKARSILDADGGRAIVGFYSGPKPLPIEDIRRHLATRCPGYLTPDSLIYVKDFPLSASGKIDTSLLVKQMSVLQIAEVTDSYQLSETDIKLTAIWCEILGLENLSVHADFFSLGGHSLLAMKVIARIRSEFGVDITVRDFFANPCVAALANIVARSVKGDSVIPGPGVTYKTTVRMAEAQRKLWFEQQLNPLIIIHNLALLFRFSGIKDVVKVREAFEHVLKSYDVFNSKYEFGESGPMQMFTGEGDLQEYNLSSGCSEQHYESLAMLAFTEMSGNLFRFSVFPEETSRDVQCFFVAHHSIFDDNSVYILINDVLAFLRGIPAQIDRRLKYIDYADWESESPHLAALKREHLTNWSQLLSSRVMKKVNLSPDYPRPATKTYAGERYIFSIPEESTNKIRQLCATHSVTTFSVILAACLRAFSNERNACDSLQIGSVVSDRGWPGLESTVGCFVKYLPLLVMVGEVKNFTDWILAAYQAISFSLSNKDVDLDELGKLFSIDNPEVYENKFSDVVINYRSDSSFEFAIDNEARFTVEQIYTHTSKFDLELSFAEADNHVINGFVEFNTDIYKRETIEGLVSSILNSFEQGAEEFELPEEADIECRVDRWVNPNLSNLFHGAVENFAKNTAIKFQADSLTYEKLDHCSSVLALELGGYLQPNELNVIAIHMEPCLELIVSILAIIKTGAAYLPLDSRVPRERLEFMLKDSGARAILVTRTPQDISSENTYSIFHEVDVCLLKQKKFAPVVQPNINPLAPCYIIYTSGTTGTPKGVLVSHENVYRLIKSTQPSFEFDSEDVWALAHSHAFDVSVWEMWGALANGGTLVIVPYWIIRTPDLFLRFLKENKVTVLNQTPSAFSSLLLSLEDDEEQDSWFVKRICFAGEKLPNQTLQTFFDCRFSDGVDVFNLYGITETTVHATLKKVGPASLDEKSVSCVGRPISDLNIYILNERLEIIEQGDTGEIYVSGPGVAIGYLNNVKLTAERFIPDPFTGGRMYKSGDLGALSKNGEILYMSRRDTQVKVRGYRIELSEIECVLGGAEGVRQALVCLSTPAQKTSNIVAYVVSQADTFDQEKILKYCRHYLPEYMVPAFIMAIPSIPLTANGKLDKLALPQPMNSLPNAADAIHAEAVVLPQWFSNSWCKVFEMPEVKISDNFFSLGGNSLMAAQLSFDLSRACKRKITVKDIFDYPNAHDLFSCIMSVESSAVFESTFELKRTDNKKVVATFLQKKMWDLFQRNPKDSTRNIYHVLKLSGKLDATAFLRAFRVVVNRHSVLRTCFQESQGVLWQYVHSDVPVKVDVFNVNDLGSAINDWIADYSRAPFDLSVHCPYRVSILELAKDEHILVVVVHHIVCDGFSFSVIYNDLSAAYNAEVSGEPKFFLDEPYQFVDFAVWQEQRLSSLDVRAMVDSAAAELYDYKAITFSRGLDGRDALERCQGIKLESLATELPVLQALAETWGVSLFSILNTVMKIIISGVFETEDVLFLIAVENRRELEDKNIVGCISNTIFTRDKISDSQSFSKLVVSVFNNLIRASARDAVPFGMIIDRYKAKNSFNGADISQISMTLQHEPLDKLRLHGLSAEPYYVHNGTSKRPIALDLYINAGVLWGALSYKSDVIDSGTAHRIATCFGDVLRLVCKDPSISVSSLLIMIKQV